MRRTSRVVEVAALCLLLLGLGGGSPAAGQAPNFGGYRVSATGAAAEWVYDHRPPPVPASPTGQLSSVFTQADLSSGPAGYGLASLLWPGQVAANVPSFVWNTFWSEAVAGGFPPENVPEQTPPNYPVRAETFYPQGPEHQTTEPGGASMRANAVALAADGFAAADHSGFPGVASMGNQTSSSSSRTEEELVIAEADARASDISIFGGLITIDSVVTRVSATSDAAVARVAGSTVVSGMEIDGHPVRITSKGIEADGESFDPGLTAIQQAIQQVLAEAGITFVLAEPVDTVDGASAQRSLGGLIVKLSSTGVTDRIDDLPEELATEIRRVVNTEHDVILTLGAAAVAAAAAPAFEFDLDFDFGGDGFLGAPGGFTSGGASGGSSVLGGTTAGTNGSAPAIDGQGAGTDDGTGGTRASANIPATEGVPFGLVAAAIGAALLASRGLAWAAGIVLASRPPDACPFEARESDER